MEFAASAMWCSLGSEWLEATAVVQVGGLPVNRCQVINGNIGCSPVVAQVNLSHRALGVNENSAQVVNDLSGTPVIRETKVISGFPDLFR